MTDYKVWDGSSDERMEIVAASPEEAAEIFAEESYRDWYAEATMLCPINVEDPDEFVTYHVVPLYPSEPECPMHREHRWEKKEVWGNNGGVLLTEECSHCKTLKITNTWDTEPTQGTQGHKTIRYVYEGYEDDPC